MNASETRIISFLEGASNRFIIPVYQRKYDWKEPHCKQLFDDLEKVHTQGRCDHFFGSVVGINATTRGHYLIVDGQQRITTVTLLLLAMHHLLVEHKIVSDSPRLHDNLWNQYLVDEYCVHAPEIKLQPIEQDQAALSALFFAPEDEWPTNSNLVDTYRYFYRRIQRSSLTTDQLFSAISSLSIVDISLSKDDNPQLVFESLNSKGLPLDEGDKIRNYILMGLEAPVQKTYYKKYWSKLEGLVQPELSGFFRDYLSVKQQVTPNIKAVYVAFKDEFEKNPSRDTEAFLQELCQYAKYYHTLLHGNSDKGLSACIDRLNRLETTVTRPFFLEVLRMYEEGALTAKDCNEIFQITEHYIFRRTICDLPTNSLNKIFLFLHRDIIRMDKTAECYLEKFKYVLLHKRERSRYPEDAEFKHWISIRNVYQMNAKNKKYLFERLENGGTTETKDVWAHLDKSEYTIEHIIPQTLTPHWMTALGADYESIHKEWLHRLANLTLTAYNTAYSNHSFLEKRDNSNGYSKSGLRMNQWIAQQSQWALPQLEMRDKALQNTAAGLWPIPVTSYSPPEKPQDVLSLEDDVSFKGRTINKFRFRTMEQPVDSWAEMYQQVLMALHSENSAILTNLALIDDPNHPLAIHFSISSDEYHSYRKITDTLFVWTGTDTQYKINTLKKIFIIFEAEESDLVFYLKEEVVGESPATLASQRKAYWEYALPQIREALEQQAFVNVSPSTSNYLDGFIGLTGVHLCCVANYNEARVELYLDSGKIESNKALFDFLLDHKSEIEGTAKQSYNWRRQEDARASKIDMVLDHIALVDESSWPYIAKFHAEEIRTLYLAMRPWLDTYKEEQ